MGTLKKTMFQFLWVFSDWGLLILRVVLGLILIVHGWPKIKDLKRVAQDFAAMGFVPGLLWGSVVALLEFLGGLFLVFGFLTQLVAGLVAIQFLVILLKIKRGASFVGGFEFDLLILASALALLILGGGFISLDQTLGLYFY
jgi:uncharacterized membrane protein YphA (DoxX/SURF4 family)